MKVTLLGSGGWDGSPAPFGESAERRTRPQLLVESEEGSFLVEASPDVRVQTQGLPKVLDFIVSHWHFDHAFGLLELDAYSLAHGPIRVLGSKETTNWVSETIKHFPITTRVLQAYKPFTLGGVSVTPLPTHHTTSDDQGTFGFLIEDSSSSVAYLADYYDLPQKTIQLASSADVVVADGTYLFEDQFPQEYQAFTKTDETHLHGPAILKACKDFKKIVFHSISSHHGLTTKQVNELLPNKFSCGYDGLVLTNLKSLDA